jgi:hypothetical protein
VRSVVVFLLWALPVLGRQEPEPEELIQQLGSDRIEDRGRAAAKLRALGKKALPALEEAARSNDPEVRQRAQELLKPIQADIAQAVLMELESKARSARSLQIRMTVHLECPELKIVTDAEGELVLQSPRKAVADLRRSILPQKEDRRTLISDGDWVVSRHDDLGWNKRAAPDDLEKKLASGWARSGLVYWWFATDGFVVWDPKAIYRGSDFRPGEPDGKFFRMHYRLWDGTDGTTIQVTLWYDPRTNLPIKRSFEGALRVQDRRDGVTPPTWRWTETYLEFLLDADVAADRFALPESKK